MNEYRVLFYSPKFSEPNKNLKILQLAYQYIKCCSVYLTGIASSLKSDFSETKMCKKKKTKRKKKQKSRVGVGMM